MSKKVITGKVRGSYVNVFQPRLNDLSGKEEYSMQVLVPMSDKETVQKLKAAIQSAITERWKEVPKNLRIPLRNGNDVNDLPESVELGQEPYADHYFFNCKSTTKPGVVDKNLHPVMDEEEFRSGDYCRVSLSVYSYDNKGNRGVSFGLQNLQVIEKGEPLGGRTRAENDFSAFGADSSSDDSLDDIF